MPDYFYEKTGSLIARIFIQKKFRQILNDTDIAQIRNWRNRKGVREIYLIITFFTSFLPFDNLFTRINVPLEGYSMRMP